MTMVSNKCDVCGIGKPIGVASTLLPLSVAYCLKCAELGAQPDIVFEQFFFDIGTNYSKMRDGLADHIITFKEGKYVTYREWADERASCV